MKFRKALKSEASLILALYNSVKGRPFCVWDDQYPDMIDIDADMAANDLFVLDDNSIIVGSISIVPQNEMDDLDCWQNAMPCGEFARVAIHPDYQGKGLSGLLVQGIFAEFIRRDIRTIHISVAKDNIPAQKLYRRMGFTFLCEKEMYGHMYILCEAVI